MKRMLSVLLVLCLLLCGSSALAAETAVRDGNELMKVTGVNFDADLLGADSPRMSLVDGVIGQVSFRMEKVNWTLRFVNGSSYTTLNDLSGVWANAFSTPLELGNNGLRVSLIQTDTGTDLYTWSVGNAKFCLVAEGPYSNNQFSAVLERIRRACGN